VYNVSGEYSMVKAAAEKGFIDEERVVREIMTSFFRAGADMVISYHTRDIFKKGWF
jgi:porphobilinogen synthase